jgi:hypothetical protein
MDTTNLELMRGDYKAFNLTFSQGGVALNLTGYTLFFTVKESTADDDEDALIAKVVTVHTDPTLGETAVILEAVDMDIPAGTYQYDFQLVNPTGKPTTVMIGTLTVIADVTRRITDEEPES